MTAIRALLPEGARVRRDRGPGIFVSKQPVESPHFRSEPHGNLWRLFPAQRLFDEFERDDPDGALTRSLERFRGIPADEASAALFSEALKLSEAPEPARIEALDRAIARGDEASRKPSPPSGLASALAKAREVRAARYESIKGRWFEYLCSIGNADLDDARRAMADAAAALAALVK